MKHILVEFYGEDGNMEGNMMQVYHDAPGKEAEILRNFADLCEKEED